jgi:hypothetical protein
LTFFQNHSGEDWLNDKDPNESIFPLHIDDHFALIPLAYKFIETGKRKADGRRMTAAAQQQKIMEESVQLSFVIMRMSFEHHKDMIFLFCVPFFIIL